MASDQEKVRDLVNTFCQSSGHDILLKLLCHIDMLRAENSVEMYPWIVDFHDETIWEVPEYQVDQARLVFETALANLNEELKPFLIIPIKGDVEVVDNLAQIKVEE